MIFAYIVHYRKKNRLFSQICELTLHAACNNAFNDILLAYQVEDKYRQYAKKESRHHRRILCRVIGQKSLDGDSQCLGIHLCKEEAGHQEVVPYAHGNKHSNRDDNRL